MTDRVVALVDMDCFYCQVEERLNPDLQGKPTVVVQYNPWKGGGIIAVNYEARAQGVKRGMRGEQAKQLCPDIVLCSVPMIREKADLARYRDAGREVIDVMCKFSECVQRASIDEAYLDLTSVIDSRLDEFQNGVPANKIANTFVVGYTSESSNDEVLRLDGTDSWLNDLYSSGLNDIDAKKLAVGAVVIEEMRREILNVTGFKCSAGIAHNKILAKLAAGIHKPNRQTVLPHASVAQLYTNLPVHKIRNLGGKLGRELEDVHGVKVMSDLLKFSQAELTKLCDERMGNWLYHLARGYDNEPVTPRLVSKSIACCKNFPGKMSLSKGKEVEHWLNKLTEELLERLLEDETMLKGGEDLLMLLTYVPQGSVVTNKSTALRFEMSRTSPDDLANTQIISYAVVILNQRKAQHMVFSIRLQDGDRGKEIASSKSVPLLGYNHDKIVNSAKTCLKKFCSQDANTLVWSPTITFLGLSAGKFADTSNKIMQLFNAMKNNRTSRADQPKETISEDTTTQNRDYVHNEATEASSTKSHYFSVGVSSTNIAVPPTAGVETNSRLDAPASLKDETVNHSSLDESTGPSFFEKMLLDSVPHNGKRIKLNIIPDLSQMSPRKNLEEAEVDIRDPRPSFSEPKVKTNKISDFFAKSPAANVLGQVNTNTKIVKPFGTFFGKQTANWVDPKEIFPDADGIDDATLALFPPSYQKKILELKNLRVKDVENEGSSKPLGQCLDADSGVCSGLRKTQIQNLDSKSSSMPSTSKGVNVQPSEMEGGVLADCTASVTPPNMQYAFHDSQQPSTSKCGLRMDSSPEDMFACDPSDFLRPGPSIVPTSPKWFSNESNPSLDNCVEGSTLTCPECQVFLTPEEYDEHRDYHFALRLQEEMNQQTSANRPQPANSSTSKPLKRKNNQKKGKQPETKKIKSIDLFFKKAS